MSTNGANVEDTEMADCEEEKVVTMMDVLQEQQEFEEDANAVLGASDDKNCTYSKGYIKRQAVYACLTCCNEAKHDPDKRAGVCLACSLTCHENHDLVELYTKRNFRCDCGNPKFNHPCQYTENKTTLNEDNAYNQNFSGLYCTCHRPYPDPDGVEEEMIQCIICEDWLHASHLEATVPSNDLYSEMICKACMDKNEFLHDYGKYAVNGDVDVVDTSEIMENSLHCNGSTNEMNGNDTKTDVDKAETEESHVPEEMKKEDNPTEAMNTIIMNVDENKPEEEMPKNVPISESTDDENPQTEIKVEHTVPEKTVDETPIEDKLSNNIIIDKTDDDTAVEENKVKDDNKEDTPISDDSTDNKLSSNLDSGDGSEDQENSDVSNNKVDGTTDNTDVNISEQTKKENQTDLPQESNGSDASAEQKVDGKTDEDIKKGNLEQQTIPTDSIPVSDADKSVDISQEDEIKENKRKLSTEESTNDISAKKPKLTESDCLRPQGQKKMFKGATFWPCNFRQKLCTCSECITMYKDLSVLFLIDPEDTVTAYEALGKEKTDGAASTQYEKGLEALSSLGRIQQINALTEYNKMRDKLLDFLKSFKDRKEVVKEEDIKAFFAGMKPKREPDGVYFCR